jgi:hypothetical protein
MALTLTPASRLDWQGLVIFASRRRRTVCFAVVRPHSTRTNPYDRRTRNEHTHRLVHSRALCLSNPASKGRRWRRDASRAAILRLWQSFLTFVTALHSLSPPTTQTQHNNNNPTFVVVDTPLHLCFLATKTSRRAIPFTSSRRPVSLFTQLFVFLDILEIFYSSAS